MRGGCSGSSRAAGSVVPGRLLPVLALVLLLAAPLASAGTISLEWDPVPDPDVTGYRVYYGLAPTALTAVADAGALNATTIGGLADCTTWYLAVRSYDGGGLESVESSNIVMGWPRPVVVSASPRSIHPGEQALLTVTGTNFDPGVPGDARHPGASVEFSHPGLRVLEVSHDACGQVRVLVEALSDALPGWSSLTVKNVDVSWNDPSVRPQVYGTLDQGLEVLEAASNDAPLVSDIVPLAGATGVAVAVRPLIRFSEAVDPASVTALTVRLLDASGAASSRTSARTGRSRPGTRETAAREEPLHPPRIP
jgi:hypothetical protein